MLVRWVWPAALAGTFLCWVGLLTVHYDHLPHPAVGHTQTATRPNHSNLSIPRTLTTTSSPDPFSAPAPFSAPNPPATLISPYPAVSPDPGPSTDPRPTFQSFLPEPGASSPHPEPPVTGPASTTDRGYAGTFFLIWEGLLPRR